MKKRNLINFFCKQSFQSLWRTTEYTKKRPSKWAVKGNSGRHDVFFPSLSRSCSLSPVLRGVETSHRNSQDNTGVWLMRNVTSIQQTCKEDVTAACTQAPTLHCVFAPECPAHLLPSCSTQTFLKLGPFLQSCSKFPPLSLSLPVLVKQRI